MTDLLDTVRLTVRTLPACISALAMPVAATMPMPAVAAAPAFVMPAEPKLVVDTTYVDPRAPSASVTVAFDQLDGNSAALRYLTIPGNGAPAVSMMPGRDYRPVSGALLFWPGGATRRQVTIPLLGTASIGQRMALRILYYHTNGQQEVIDYPIEVRAGAGADAARIRPVPRVATRPARTFTPPGNPAWAMDPATARWSDRGDATTWTTALPARMRTQPGTGESSFYADPVSHGLPEPNIVRRSDAIVVRSYRATTPIQVDGKAHRDIAAMLSGEKLVASHGRYGTWEIEARLPDRMGTFPAFWLMPVAGGWPPEIDVMEAFNWLGQDPDRWVAQTVIAGSGGRTSFKRSIANDVYATFDIEPTLTTDFHRYGVTVDSTWITFWVDRRETYQVRNPFPGTEWYPLFNVGINKVKADDPYTKGSGDMIVRAVRRWAL